MSHCVSLGHCISHHLPWRYICSAKKVTKYDNTITQNPVLGKLLVIQNRSQLGVPNVTSIQLPTKTHSHLSLPSAYHHVPPQTQWVNMSLGIMFVYVGWYAIFLFCHRYSDQRPKKLPIFKLMQWPTRCSNPFKPISWQFWNQPRFYHLQLSLWAFFDHLHLMKVRAFRVCLWSSQTSFNFFAFWAKC